VRGGKREEENHRAPHPLLVSLIRVKGKKKQVSPAKFGGKSKEIKTARGAEEKCRGMFDKKHWDSKGTCQHDWREKALQAEPERKFGHQNPD